MARRIAPALVIDLGTTTNIEVIDQSGGFCGGVIAPGIDVSARAVSESAAKLTQITMKAPKSIIGKTPTTPCARASSWERLPASTGWSP